MSIVKFDMPDACFDFLIRSILAVENVHIEFDNTRGYKWCLK